MSTVSEVLQGKGNSVLTVNTDASVLDAIGIMSEANIGALVIQQDERPVGIFTERDYMRKIALKGRASGNTPVRDVMSSPLITVASDEPTSTAMEVMTKRRCRHLVVMDDEVMTGIVSLGDLVKYMLQEKEAEVEQLSQYIAGSY
jgi:CBS domain-containing protein